MFFCKSMLKLYGFFIIFELLNSTQSTVILLLTLFILMDFCMHVDKISMELPILHFKGSQVDFSMWWCISVRRFFFHLCKQCRPWWNAALSSISAGSALFAKASFCRYLEWKGLYGFVTGKIKVWIQISWFHQKPADLDPHCFQKRVYFEQRFVHGVLIMSKMIHQLSPSCYLYHM